MADPLSAIPIQELKAFPEGRDWQLDQHLEGLPSLTPVRGRVRAVHRSNVLEVEGEASTIVTLCCDRCLQTFNQALSCRNRELIWLGEASRSDGVDEDVVLESAAQLLDLEADAFTESLDPAGDFDPAHWIFEQLHLLLPVVNHCGELCPGPNLAGPGQGAAGGDAAGAGPIDPRWAALKQLAP
ncbi:MAG: DUF177 domain-containing protein [Synechococcales cyanobacterium SupBloom_Metag_052]|jgi:uncharacterized protein|nr:DUF177 domain-containing protein [Synechococcales cyanobacterium SupBloom_Metag_052]